MPPRHDRSLDVDAPAFLFAVKFVAVVALMVGATHVGVSALAESWFSGETTTASVPLRETYTLLDGATSIGSQFVPSVTQAAAPEAESLRAFVPATGKFIGIDLGEREVRLYERGSLVDIFPILKAPVPGTHWDPPQGSYEVIDRHTNHRSHVSGVSLPYTVEFFGNFFIHGWPYTPQGGAVAEDYPGGGVTLASRDAQAVFSFARVGTPVHVVTSSNLTATRARSLGVRGDLAPPRLSARAYVVGDLATGEVLLGKDEDRRLPIASVTKLMTAVVAGDMIHQDELVYLPYKGDSYTSSDLLYPLMLRSDNAVSNAYANHADWDTFMRWMNEKADALGMRDTAFQDPSGLSARNISTPLDLFRLARHLYTETAYILAASKEDAWSITSSRGSRWSMTNQNRFAGDAYFVGGKLGFTDEAKKTGLSVLAVPIDDDVRIVTVVILGSDDWKGDTDKLVAWLTRAGMAK